MQTNRTYEQVRIDLWNIKKLGVRRVQQALLSLIPAQIPHEIVPMMRECLKASKRDVELIQYLQVIDLILSHPIFNQILHSCLLEFYPMIVSSLLKAGYRRQVEEAKVIRKYWVRRIHPGLYVDLKEATLRMSGIDIDFIDINFNPDALLHIRHFYTNVLNMPPQELYYHLPQVLDLLPQYQRPEKSNLSNNFDFSNEGGFSRTHQTPTRQLQHNRATIQNDRISSNHLSQKKVSLPQYTIGKRIRYSSEETNAGDPSEYYETIRKIPPKVIDVANIYFDRSEEPQHFQQKHSVSTKEKEPESLYPQAALQAKKLRDNIKQLCRFECSECAARFETKEHLDEHRENHIKDKLARHEEKEIKNKVVQKSEKHTYYLTESRWSLINDEKVQNKAKQIIIPDGDKPQAEIDCACTFCGQDFEQRFQDDEWRLYNAVRALFNTQNSCSFHKNSQSYVHASCAKAILKAKNSLCDWQVQLA